MKLEMKETTSIDNDYTCISLTNAGNSNDVIRLPLPLDVKSSVVADLVSNIMARRKKSAIAILVKAWIEWLDTNPEKPMPDLVQYEVPGLHLNILAKYRAANH